MTESALFRLSHTNFNQPVEFTATQALVDSGTTRFLEESARFSTFASIVTAGGAARFARTGILALGANATGRGALLVQGLAEVGSLGAEVVAFEGSARGISSLQGNGIHNPNLWHWNGEGGLRQGLFTSGINFTAFRWAGRVSQRENIVFQHAAQSSAMVLGHNIAGALNLIHRPDEPLALQFFTAEQTNLQLVSGLGALHIMAPGIHGFERSLDLSNQARIGTRRPLLLTEGRDLFDDAVLEGAEAGGKRETRPERSTPEEIIPNQVLMVTGGDPPGGPPSGRKGRSDSGEFPATDSSRGDRVSGLPRAPTGISSMVRRVLDFGDSATIKEGLIRMFSGLSGANQEVELLFLQAIEKAERGEAVHDLLNQILTHPTLRTSRFLSDEVREDVSRRITAMAKGSPVPSNGHETASRQGTPPSLPEFKRMVAETGNSPEQTARTLNWLYHPAIDLRNYASFVGEHFYISGEADASRLRDYARLDYQSLGEVLFFARRRLSRNWSLNETARDHLQMDPIELDLIERNQRAATTEQLQQFSRVYGIDLAFLSNRAAHTTLTEGPVEYPVAPGSEDGATTSHPSSKPPNISTDTARRIEDQRLAYLTSVTSKTPVSEWPLPPEHVATESLRIANSKSRRLREVEKESEIDLKTLVLNDRGWERMARHVEATLQANRRSEGQEGKLIIVIMSDADNFKLVNDTYGHANGDRVLKALGLAQKNAVRGLGDFVFRYGGGEEFGICLRPTKAIGPEKVIKRVQTFLANNPIALDGWAPIHVTLSFGVAEVRLLPSPDKPGEFISEGAFKDGLKRADRALYVAKRNGRNRAEFSTE